MFFSAVEVINHWLYKAFVHVRNVYSFYCMYDIGLLTVCGECVLTNLHVLFTVYVCINAHWCIVLRV